MANQLMDEMQAAYRDLMQPGEVVETPLSQRMAARFDGAVGGIQTPLNPFPDHLPGTQSGTRRRGLYIPHGTNEVSDAEVHGKDQADKYPPTSILGRAVIIGGVQAWNWLKSFNGLMDTVGGIVVMSMINLLAGLWILRLNRGL